MPVNGLAIAALVFGIVWLFRLGSVLALVFGYVARTQIWERRERGGGIATAGIVLGWIGLAVLAVGIIVASIREIPGTSATRPFPTAPPATAPPFVSPDARILEVVEDVRCDRPPQLRFSVPTTDPAVVFMRFYIDGKEVFASGSPMGTFTRFHEVAVLQFQPGGEIVVPCEVPAGTRVDWVAQATFPDGRVSEMEGALEGSGNTITDVSDQ